MLPNKHSCLTFLRTVAVQSDTRIFSDKSKSMLTQASPHAKHYSKFCVARRKQTSVYRHTEGNMTTRAVEAPLTISMYRGEYTGDLASLVHICDVEGCVAPDVRQPFSLFEETLRVLETCGEGTPRPSSEYVTVFIGRKTRTGVKPQARISIAARDGRIGACFRLEASTRVDIEVVDHGDDKDVVTVVRKVLEVFVRGNRLSNTLYPQSRWSQGHA
jgi:hypothetical protein